MRRRLFLFGAVAVVTLVFGACGSVRPYAARVNGQAIEQSELEQELRAIRDNSQLDEQAREGVDGAGEGTFRSEFVAQVLTRQIQLELVDQELERRDLTVTDQDRERARQELGGGEPAAAAVFEGYPESFRQVLVERSAKLAKIQAVVGKQRVDDQAVRRFYDENPDRFAETCVSHILVDTREQAEALKAQLAAGADFATLARANSKDNQGQGGGSAGQGGALPCVTKGQLVPEFEAAMEGLPLAQVSDPVQTQFGFHLIKVTERRTRPFEAAEPEIRQLLLEQSSGELSRLLEDQIEKARVQVNPRYGRFEKKGAVSEVVPPQVPRAARGAQGGGTSPSPGEP